MNKGGKFIFGITKVNLDMGVRIPLQALQEYAIKSKGKVFLISGSKKSGGFLVIKKE